MADQYTAATTGYGAGTMLLTTTATVEGRTVRHYIGICSGETILGVNVFKDIFAGVRDIVGGRSDAYEQELRKAKDTAIREMMQQAAAMGANAIIGIDLDYETLGKGGGMLMVSASGTAVVLE